MHRHVLIGSAAEADGVVGKALRAASRAGSAFR
jgi:hypothetical protein